MSLPGLLLFWFVLTFDLKNTFPDTSRFAEIENRRASLDYQYERQDSSNNNHDVF